MRKKTIGILVFLVSGSVLTAFGQTPTVTNADLEKYREKRLAAQKDLSENYEELGFPSPEELLEMEANSRRERVRIVSELRRTDSEAARLQYERYRTVDSGAPVFTYPNPGFVDYGGRYAPSYLYYRFYDPYRFRYGKHYLKEPPRFRTLRRLWRQASPGTVTGIPGRRR